MTEIVKCNISILVCCLLMFHGLPMAADRQPGNDKIHPVQWDEHLIPYYVKKKASSIEELRELLGATWKDDDGKELEFVVEERVGSTSRKTAIRNCNELLYSFNNITDVITKDISLINVLGWRSSCLAIEKVINMIDAKTTYLSPNIKAMLPYLGKIQINSDDEIFKNFFSELDKAIKLKCKRKSMCVVTTENEIMRVQIDAVGDFNNDGIQDAIILADKGPKNGNGGWCIGLLVTRLRKGGPLKLLEWW